MQGHTIGALADALEAATEPEWEHRIDDGQRIHYTQTQSRVDRALQKGHKVWRRTAEVRASAWEPVGGTE